MQAIQRHYGDTEDMTFLHFVHSSLEETICRFIIFLFPYVCPLLIDFSPWLWHETLFCPLTRKLSPFGATRRGNDLVSTNCGRKQPSSFCLMNHKETICLFKDHTFRLRRRLKQMRCQWGRFYLLWNSPLPSLFQKMRTRAVCRVKF